MTIYKNTSLAFSILKTIDNNLWNKTGVYKITNINNNKFYIGSTSRSFKSRFCNHIQSLSNKSHYNFKLQQDFLIYGINSFVFEILELTSPKEAVKIEQKYLNNLNPYYNILLKADSALGHKMSIEHKNKISKAKTKNINEFELIKYYLKFGIKKTTSKFHIGPPRINRILFNHNIPRNKSGPSIKTMENYLKYNPNRIIKMYKSGMSIRNIRKKEHTSLKRISETLKSNNIEINKHPPLNKKQIEKLKKSHKNIIFTNEWKNNISKGKLGQCLCGDNGNSKIVINSKTNIIYSSIQEVSELFNIKIYLLSDKLHGKSKNDTDFIFYEEYKRINQLA